MMRREQVADHFFSRQEDRLEFLKEVEAFLRALERA